MQLKVLTKRILTWKIGKVFSLDFLEKNNKFLLEIWKSSRKLCFKNLFVECNSISLYCKRQSLFVVCYLKICFSLQIKTNQSTSPFIQKANYFYKEKRRKRTILTDFSINFLINLILEQKLSYNYLLDWFRTSILWIADRHFCSNW